MSDVTIPTSTFFFGPPNGLTSVEARVYVNAPFLPNGDLTPVTSGAVNSSHFYKRYTCSAVGGVLTLPDITLPATTDGAPNTSKYTLALYAPGQTTPSNGIIEKIAAFESFALPPGTPQTWANVFSFNAAAGVVAAATIKGYPKTIEINTATASNTLTGLDPLHSYSLLANSLAADGDRVIAEYGGFYGVNDNDKRLTGSFGGTEYFNTGLRDVDGSATDAAWRVEVAIIRLSATSVRITTMVNRRGGG